MSNEIAPVLFLALFGWLVAPIYPPPGLAIAMVGGWAIGPIQMEQYIEDWLTRLTQEESSGLQPPREQGETGTHPCAGHRRATSSEIL